MQIALVSAGALILGTILGIVGKAIVDRWNENRERRRAEVDQFWMPLADQLSNSRVSFELQTMLRSRLMELLRKRGVSPSSGEQYPDFFARVYPELNEKERDLHSFIRAITFGWMLKANSTMANLLEAHPQWSFRLEEQTGQLRRHLMLWLAKASRDQTREEACLVYTGVDEKTEFPQGAERAVRTFADSLKV